MVDSFEKRYAVRYDLLIEFTLIPLGFGDPYRGVSVNLSEGGVLLLTDRKHSLGTVLRLESRVFEATGEVVWTWDTESEAAVGIRFVSLSSKDRDAVLAMLEPPPREG